MKRRALLLAASLSALPAASVGDEAQRTRAARARTWFTDSALIDQDGRTYAFYSDLLAPRTVLINAAFVGCGSACPLLTQKLVALREALAEHFGRALWFLSITVDPLNDGPDQLKRFAQRHGADVPGWRFLTGRPENVKLVLSRLGLWADEPDQHQTVLIAGRAAAGHWGKLRPEGSVQDLRLQLLRFLG